MKVRIFLLSAFQLFLFRVYSQNIQLLEKSFHPLSDSILIKNDSYNELDQLLEIAEKKDIVAVGEVTHGTDEVLHFQTLIAKKLIVKYNFKTLILGETSLIESIKMYDYVVHGSGNFNNLQYPKHLKDLLIFLKEYNSKLPSQSKILVLGTDVDDPVAIINFAQKYFENSKDEVALNNIENLKLLINTRKYLNNNDLELIKGAVYKIKESLNNQNNKADSSYFKNKILHQAFNIFLLNVSKNLNFEVFTQTRDSYIFRNFDWIKSFSLGKIVIINTHNFHINRKTINTELFGNHKTFGEQISEKYENKYFCIGTEVQQGVFRSNAVLPEKIIEHNYKLGNIIASFSDAKFGYLISDSTNKSTLNHNKMKITYGTSKNIDKYMVFEGKSLIGNAFDAIFFIKNSQAYVYENNYFTLFIKLSKYLESKIIEEGFLKFSANYSLIEKSNDSNFGIFLNDKDKILLQNYSGNLNDKIENLEFKVPKQSKYISINLNIRDLAKFNLAKVIINDVQILFNEIELYDWNNAGFKKVENIDSISISRN